MEPFRNNQTKPNQTQTRPFRSPGGISRGRVEVNRGPGSIRSGLEEQKFEDRLAKEYAFVREVLPEENPGLAVSALLSIRALGEKVTRDSVLARLEATGRSRAQREAAK